MKKLTFLLLMMSMGLVSYGQLEIKPGVGLNYTNLSQDPESGSFSGKAGWLVGASVLSGDKFYGEAGVFYLEKSLEFSSTDPMITDFTKKVQGVRIPVSFGYHLLGHETSTATLRVFGGGSVFFVTNVDGDIDKDDITSPQWGVYLGAGLDISIFYLDAKYEWSLTDVSSVTDFDIGKYRGFFLTAGVRF